MLFGYNLIQAIKKYSKIVAYVLKIYFSGIWLSIKPVLKLQQSSFYDVFLLNKDYGQFYPVITPAY